MTTLKLELTDTELKALQSVLFWMDLGKATGRVSEDRQQEMHEVVEKLIEALDEVS